MLCKARGNTYFYTVKSRLLIILFSVISVWLFLSRENWKGNMYSYDIDGYYVYLPAMFIYHDMGNMAFHRDVQMKYGVSEDTYYIFPQPNGRRTNMYAVGTALFQMPLFLAAYAWADHVDGYKPDGYDTPFQVAGFFSNLLWVLLGLWVLRKFLLFYFNDTVTALVLACIAFGTNLYTYTVFTPGMSHTYVFFIYAAMLYYIHRWYTLGTKQPFYMLALLVGLAVITRPIAGIVGLLVLLWGVNSLGAWRERVSFLLEQGSRWLVATGIFMLVALVQMSYWKYTSGHWIFFSYQNDGFDFLHSKLWDGLVGYRKGWFVYTPVALAGMAGLALMWWRDKRQAPVFTGFFIVIIYVVFSWRNWWYGGSFSCRALIDVLPVLAYPLGIFTAWVLASRRKIALAGMLVFYSGCIALNCFQSYQYVENILHCDRMSKTFYWKIFGKTEINNAEVDPYLMSEHDYNEEIKRRFNRR